MESWLPWLVDDDAARCPTCSPADAPGRAGRADAGCAIAPPTSWPRRPTSPRTLATHLGRGRRRERAAACTCRFDRLLARTDAPVWSSSPPSPEVPTSRVLAATGWDPSSGEGGRRPVTRSSSSCADGYRIVVAADGAGLGRPARRPASATRASTCSWPIDDTEPSEPGGRVVVAAARAGRGARRREAGRAGRARPHRSPPHPPPATRRQRDAQRFFDDLAAGRLRRAPASTVWPGTAAWSPGRSAGAERDYLLLEYRGDDKLYVPSDQIDAVRHYTGGDTPSLSQMGGADWQKAKAQGPLGGRGDRPGAGGALPDAGRPPPGHAFAAGHAVAARARGRLPVPGDPRPARRHRRRQGRHGARCRRWTASSAATSASARPRWRVRAAFKAIQDGKQVAILVPTTLLAQQHLQTFRERFAAYPVRVEVLSRFLTPEQARAVVEGVETGEVDVVIGTHRLLSEDVDVQEPRPAGRRRGAAVRREAQGGDQAAADRRRRADAHRHADPPHARDEPHRHPRPDAAQHAAGRPPADPHLRRRVRRAGRRRGHPPRAAARGPGVLRAQPGAGHRARRGRAARAGARGPDRRRPRPDGRGHARAGGDRLLGRRVRRPGVHDDHRVGHRHADGEHAGGRPGRPARSRSAPPAAGPGRPGRHRGPTPTCSRPPTGR